MTNLANALPIHRVFPTNRHCPAGSNQNCEWNPNDRPTSQYRNLPAVDALLRQDAVIALTVAHGPDLVTRTLRELLETARAAIADGQPAPAPESWPDRLAAALADLAAPTLRPLINATGIIVHTNLGRAPSAMTPARPWTPRPRAIPIWNTTWKRANGAAAMTTAGICSAA